MRTLEPGEAVRPYGEIDTGHVENGPHEHLPDHRAPSHLRHEGREARQDPLLMGLTYRFEPGRWKAASSARWKTGSKSA